MIYIGIDPDVNKSGVACWNKSTMTLTVQCLKFFELFTYLKDVGGPNKIFIEAGWLNKKSNFHGSHTANVSARIGKNVGENHATGKLLVEAMEFYKIPFRIVKPTTEKWDADFFKKVTKLERRTNPEERDALKLVWG